MNQELPDKLINYDDALEYWESIPATVDGVLGGFGDATVVPSRDIAQSMKFIRKLSSRIKPEADEEKYGLELGAGIGRVTKNLLSKICTKVDLVEYNPKFVDQMHQELQGLSQLVGDIYTIGMQDFVPDKKYWVVWAQWCLGYLPDEKLVEFLKLMGLALSANGILIVKENNCRTAEDEFDEQDSSVTRTDEKFKQLFQASGLKLIAQETQKGFPEVLFPVKIYALKSVS